MQRKPPPQPDGWLEMGRVAGSYGVRGWLKVVPGGGALEGLAGAGEWRIGERSYRVDEARAHSGTVVAKLAGVETREQALELRGLKVSVARGALAEPEEGRYYLADLIGLEVVNEKGEALGEAKRFFSNGPQDVMEVASGGTTRLMPWVAAVVKEVDLAARRIVVEWEPDW